VTAHLEAIRGHLASFEMHVHSEQKDWQDTPMKRISFSLPLDTSLKSATSEHSTTCTAQDLGLRVSLLPETASESLGMSGGTSAEAASMLQGLVYLETPRKQTAGDRSSSSCVVQGRFDNSLDHAAQQQEASLLAA